jgi:hypothetical protein
MRQWFKKNILIERVRIFNTTTQTWPCHAHFNGDSKVLMVNEIKDIVLNKITNPQKLQSLYAHLEE